MFRVLRPGGRAVLNIGVRVSAGTQTHRILNDSAWVWAGADVRSMVEQAGFADVTTQYVPWCEDTAVNRMFARRSYACAWPAASSCSGGIDSAGARRLG